MEKAVAKVLLIILEARLKKLSSFSFKDGNTEWVLLEAEIESLKKFIEEIQ